jgi:hypothetical protein
VLNQEGLNDVRFEGDKTSNFISLEFEKFSNPVLWSFSYFFFFFFSRYDFPNECQSTTARPITTTTPQRAMKTPNITLSFFRLTSYA